MGVGRRMKKQGMPDQLDEAHFTNLKRKAGMSVTESRAESLQYVSSKKRRKSSSGDAGNNIESSGKKSKTGKETPKKSASGVGLPSQKSALKKAKKAEEVPLPQSDEDMGNEDSDEAMGDEFDDLDAEGGLGDDFLDSESEVYDSGDDHQTIAMFSEDEDESDAEEKLTAANIAGLTRKLDDQMAEEAADAQAELEEAALQTNIAGDRPHILDDPDSDEEGVKKNDLLAPDLQLLRTRINDTVRVLDDFSNLSEEGRSRAEYTAQLIKDICAYYGYSEYLAEKLFNLFPPKEAFAFFEANETHRPVVIRTNTLRTHRRDLAQALINRGVVLEPVGKWSKIGLQIFESAVPLGATPEYLAGHYILQAASSFLPVMALAPQEHERVLDMAAAPGGKTTHIAALMKNTGCIFANDSNKSRAKGLIGNIHRLGAKNTIVCNYDAREFPKVIGGFDRVLLDAPCSGTGVIAKDASVKTNKTEKDFLMLPHLQKQLLLAAIDSVDHASKTGGYIVYSTCSVTVEENEQVVQYALSRRPNVKLVETNLVFGKEGFTSYMGKNFHASMKLTRRYYPHAYNVDGFFVSKFKKFGPSPKGGVDAFGNIGSGGKGDEDEEIVDKRPVPENDEEAKEQAFGGWDDSEDEQYMERAKKSGLRRKGVDPKATRGDKSKKGEKKAVVSEPEAGEDTEMSGSEPVIAKNERKNAKQNGKREKKPAVAEIVDTEMSEPEPAVAKGSIELKKGKQKGKKEKKPAEIPQVSQDVEMSEPVVAKDEVELKKTKQNGKKEKKGKKSKEA
ncbi:probable nucleolar protein [Rhynchosporium secalis]|uniref:Nucleolar protein 2 n=1 Tax=Rhynchosporium secalis TaxID=38038 RepID=A0A1E1MJN4_RHYSE|nr:probable nucleolar protein [Rhynchosporium secalis]